MINIPGINVKLDALDALLAIIGYRIAMLSQSNHSEFDALIAGRDVTLQLGSNQSGVARHYRFKNGRFSQHQGKAESPDLEIDFIDSATGVSLLTGGNAMAFMSAIQDGKLTMEGDYSLLMWFNQLAKHLIPQVPEQYQPYVQQTKPYVYKAQSFAKHWYGYAKHKLGQNKP